MDCGEERVSRIIKKSKYEGECSDSYNWWQKMFKTMEKESTLEPSQRRQVVEEIFPKQVVGKILDLLSVESEEGIPTRRPHKTSDISVLSTRTEKTEKTERTMLTGTTFTSSTTKKDVKDQYCTQVLLAYDVKPTKAGPKNPYLQFFKRKPERAAIWHVLPPLKLEEMNLSQQSEAITEAIAVDFVQWMTRLGGETPTTLDVPQIMKMFEIGFHTHAATSLATRIKELPAIAKQVAELRETPKKSIRAKLQQKLNQDIAAFNKRKKFLAFGSTLPSDLRYIPPRVDNAKKFLHVEAPERLKTMSAVWKGITETGCTRGYCKWLIDHPELPAPKFLEDLGMLTLEYHLKCQPSSESLLSDALG